MVRILRLALWTLVVVTATRAGAQSSALTTSPGYLRPPGGTYPGAPPNSSAGSPYTTPYGGYGGGGGANSSQPITSYLNPGNGEPGGQLGGAAATAEPLSPHLDLDSYLSPSAYFGDEWTWQLMPSNLIYKSYLAGVKETRLASQHINIKEDGWLWDAVLGGRVGLLRYGNQDPIRPDGFQLDFEGSAQVRLDVTNDVDVRSVDFRGGIPLTYGSGPWRTKFGYYHLSSHLGDEFLLAHPGYNRLNYSRDCLVLGETVFLTDRLRIYAEMAWAFYNDVNKPWEFQFGVDYSPVAPTGFMGEPFFAVNGHLRQELNYSGHFVAQTGWAWVSDENTRLLRIGFFYFNGLSNQYSFYNQWEQQIGAAIWYDY